LNLNDLPFVLLTLLKEMNSSDAVRNNTNSTKSEAKDQNKTFFMIDITDLRTKTNITIIICSKPASIY
jgi:hypothetical protein